LFRYAKAIISEDKRPEILQLAIDRNQDNIHVWAEVLEYNVIHFDCYKTLKHIFDVGNQALGNKSLLLWEIMDSFLQQYCDVTLVYYNYYFDILGIPTYE